MLVSRRKFYLSGSDWGIHAVDYLMKKALGAGNLCQLVLKLEGSLDPQELRSRLEGFCHRFPLLYGRAARDFKLTPYWKIPAKAKGDVTLKVTSIPDGTDNAEIHRLLQENANAPVANDRMYLDFHLFCSSNSSILAVRFDHRLFDGRGVEWFMGLFQQSMEDDTISGDIVFESSMELTEWNRKFMAGRNVNRTFISLSQETPRSFDFEPTPGSGFRCRMLCFDREETAAIYEKAYREAGYLMESPFLLAAITQAVHQLFEARGEANGSCYLVPVTVDTRPGRGRLQEIFFNQLSYLFYQIPVDRTGDLKQLSSIIRQQMYDQVKSGFPKDMAEASLLARILPLGLYGKLLKLPVKGKIATFAFSHLGKGAYQHDSFMGRRISNIFHMPRVPYPPGIGFFSNSSGGRLNMAISYINGIVSDAELDLLEQAIRKKTGATGG